MAQFENRDKLKKYLVENEIGAKVHYPIPLHLQEASKSLGYALGDFPASEIYGQKILTLPAHQFIKGEQIEFMLEKISSFYDSQ